MGDIDKLYKKKAKPAKGEADALYFIGDANSNYIDFYVTDKKGNLVPVIDNNRFIGGTPVVDLKVIDYRSDTMNLGPDYYYGYEYEDNSFKIIKVEKGNIVNQTKATATIGTFDTNWTNRLGLTYN